MTTASQHKTTQDMLEKLDLVAKHQELAIINAVILFGKAKLDDDNKALLSSVIDDLETSLINLNGTNLHSISTDDK